MDFWELRSYITHHLSVSVASSVCCLTASAGTDGALLRGVCYILFPHQGLRWHLPQVRPNLYNQVLPAAFYMREKTNSLHWGSRSSASEVLWCRQSGWQKRSFLCLANSVWQRWCCPANRKSLASGADLIPPEALPSWSHWHRYFCRRLQDWWAPGRFQVNLKARLLFGTRGIKKKEVILSTIQKLGTAKGS